MKLKFTATALLALTLSACTSGPVHKSKMEDILDSYGAAIRWGEFERAQEFQTASKRTRLDLEWLKNIHVSSYEVMHKVGDLGEPNDFEQTVRIRYYIEPAGAEKTITDRQLWRYDEDLDRMMLDTPIPVFQ